MPYPLPDPWLPWPLKIIVGWLKAIWRNQHVGNWKLDQLLIMSAQANHKLDQLLSEISQDENTPGQPGEFQIKVESQVSIGGVTMQKFSIVNIPAIDMTDPNNSDMDDPGAARNLHVKVGSQDTISLVVPGVDAVDKLQDDRFVGQSGDQGAAVMTYADASTPPNVSAPRIVPFTLTDTTAPSQPGDFGVQSEGQA